MGGWREEVGAGGMEGGWKRQRWDEGGLLEAVGGRGSEELRKLLKLQDATLQELTPAASAPPPLVAKVTLGEREERAGHTCRLNCCPPILP